MPLYPIFHRHGAAPIAVVEAETYREALEYAIRRGTRLVYADLKGIDVPRAFLARGDFRGADLRAARLEGVSLHKADLRAARLEGAVLKHACLWNTDLRHADLRDADLRHANLKDARLVGADLRGALLIGAKLDGAILDWRWSTVALESCAGLATARVTPSRRSPSLPSMTMPGRTPGSKFSWARDRTLAGCWVCCRDTSARATTPPSS